MVRSAVLLVTDATPMYVTLDLGTIEQTYREHCLIRQFLSAMTWPTVLLLAQALAANPSPPLATQARSAEEAVLHAVENLYALGMQDDTTFFAYGFDILLCLETIAGRSADTVTRRRTLDAARALGRKWKREYTDVPEEADAAQLQRLLFGLFALERLGMHHQTLKHELIHMAPRFGVAELLRFHPGTHSPESADAAPHAGRPRAGTAGAMQPPAEDAAARRGAGGLGAWAGALTRTLVAEKLQVPLGREGEARASYDDVLRWRSSYIPYAGAGAMTLAQFREQAGLDPRSAPHVAMRLCPAQRRPIRPRARRRPSQSMRCSRLSPTSLALPSPATCSAPSSTLLAATLARRSAPRRSRSSRRCSTHCARSTYPSKTTTA